MRRTFSFFIATIISLCLYANEGDSIVKVFQKDNIIVSIPKQEIKKITYSIRESEDSLHDENITQLIYTKDSVHSWPLNIVDSVTFVWISDENNGEWYSNPAVWTRNAINYDCGKSTMRGRLKGVNTSEVSQLGFYFGSTPNEAKRNGEYYEAKIDDAKKGYFSCDLSDLSLDENYYYKASAVYQGRTYEGLVNSFHTNGFSFSGTVSRIGSFSAEITIKIDLCDLSGITAGFYYNATGNPNEKNATMVSGNVVNGSFTETISDLRPNTDYYVRSFVKVDGKEFFGTTMSFRTKDLIFKNLFSDSIGSFTAWLHGEYAYDDDLLPDYVGFYYNQEGSPTMENAIAVNCKDVKEIFKCRISGLEPLRKYYFRAFIDVNGDRYISEKVEELTAKGIVLQTESATNITESSAILNGNISYQGPLDELSRVVGFYYSIYGRERNRESTEPVAYLSQLIDGNFSYKLEKLLPGDTVYYMTFYYSENKNASNGDVAYFIMPDKTQHLSLCPDDNHPHMIDLGLPSGIKWACCNIGANAPEQSGGYYAWGETSTKSIYNWSTYKYGNSIFDCENIGSDISGTSYDAATANWGTLWQMPNREQQDELINNCSYQWISNNGVKGALLTGPNGNMLFFPAAGVRTDDYCSNEGYYGYYPSSSLNPWDDYLSDGLFFASDGKLRNQNGREGGYCVRAVCVPEQSPTVSVWTSLANDVTVSSATISGKILEYSNSTLNWKVGFVCWLEEDTNTEYLKELGTLSDYIDGFNYNLTDLKPGQDYFYRAYIRDNDKFYYGETKQFTTSLPSADYSVYDSNNLHYYLYSGDKTATLIESWNYDLKEISIFDSIAYNGVKYAVKRIAQHAFIGCKDLAKVSIPDGVTTIGDGAFYNCTSLVSVKLPAKLKSIKSNLFAGCDHLETITIPDRVVTIKSGAFSGCVSIKDLFIPKSVKEIEIGAFDFCENLSSINVSEDNSVYDSRKNCNAIVESESNTLLLGCSSTLIPENVNEIGEYAFYGNKGLVSIMIPANITEIGIRAFSDCANLVSVLIEGKIAELRDNVFSDCTSLKTITLPSTLTKMSSLSGCKNITDLYCYATKVPDAYSFYFSDFAEKATLHVPASALTSYKNSYAWKGFKAIVAIE